MLQKSIMVHTGLIFNVNWLLNLFLIVYKWLQIVGLVPQTFHNMVGHAVYLSQKKKKIFFPKIVSHSHISGPRFKDTDMYIHRPTDSQTHRHTKTYLFSILRIN